MLLDAVVRFLNLSNISFTLYFENVSFIFSRNLQPIDTGGIIIDGKHGKVGTI